MHLTKKHRKEINCENAGDSDPVDFFIFLNFFVIFFYSLRIAYINVLPKGTIMDLLQEITKDNTLSNALSSFLSFYGPSGLSQAMQLYTDMNQEYVCRTKETLSIVRIYEIIYLEIHGHNIAVHTAHGIYQKYGSLSDELKVLSRYGFIKCNQSVLVAVHKIRSIQQDTVILTDDTCLHMSRSCAPKVIMAIAAKVSQQEL